MAERERVQHGRGKVQTRQGGNVRMVGRKLAGAECAAEDLSLRDVEKLVHVRGRLAVVQPQVQGEEEEEGGEIREERGQFGRG